MGCEPVPIVALTANVMTHQIEDYRDAGMATFVPKPIQIEALLTAIETALAATPSVIARAA
jgi:CheY-like chemotaxis protein